MSGIYVRITSADPASLMDKISAERIDICDAKYVDAMTIQIRCNRSDFSEVKRIALRYGGDISAIHLTGMWSLYETLKVRKLLVVGVFVLLSLLLILPSRVLFIDVTGNNEIPAKLILEAAENCGIHFGTSRNVIRSESVKTALLSQIPQLQWVGITTSGCTATISIKEKAPVEKVRRYETGNIIAARDGVITDLTVTRGTSVCKEGEAVTSGQMLISGYTDCGNMIKAVSPEGEVFAYTNREYTVVTPDCHTVRTNVSKQQKKYSLLIGKKLINFSKGSGILGATCVKMYSEDYLMLPGGFRLPVALITEEYTCYQTVSEICEDIEIKLVDYAEDYLMDQMQAGNILSHIQNLSHQDGIYVLDIKYICSEMIGQFVKEELIFNDGQTD